MPNAAKRHSYKPIVENVEDRIVLTAGLSGQLVEAVLPLQPSVQTFGSMRQEIPAVYGRISGEVTPRSFAATRIPQIFAPRIRPQIRNGSDPFAEMAIVDRSSLRPGDILVSTEDGTTSTAIRGVTLADYSHAALYVGDGKIIDATGDGVKKRDLSSLTNPAVRVGVIRVNNLTTSQQATVIGTAHKLLDKGYNYVGLGIGIIEELTIQRRLERLAKGEPFKISGSTLGWGYFCSELVIKTYKTAGITIAPEPGDTPGTIINFTGNRPSQFQLVGRLATGKS